MELTKPNLKNDVICLITNYNPNFFSGNKFNNVFIEFFHLEHIFCDVSFFSHRKIEVKNTPCNRNAFCTGSGGLKKGACQGGVGTRLSFVGGGYHLIFMPPFSIAGMTERTVIQESRPNSPGQLSIFLSFLATAAKKFSRCR